jgi:hypothetical protein
MVRTLSLKRAAFFLSLAACLTAQQTTSSEGTRQLYYLATPPPDTIPPLTSASTGGAGSAASPTAKAETPHLGLRYNLVLVHSSGHRTPIRSDRVLHTGDCVGVDLYANRSGYVYVFAKQSNGDWVPLLPSTQMPGESNILNLGNVLQIPKQHCFRIEDPPGEETLFVLVSRDPRDFYEIFEGYKTRGTPPPAHRPKQEPMQFADNSHLKSAVDHLDEEFGKRNISIASVDAPKEKSEPPGSVYVVNTSDHPTSTIVTKIIIRHN